MKRYLIISLLLAGICLPAAAYDFSMLQGLKTTDSKGNENFYMEMSGYSIFASTMKGKISNPKNIAAFKRKLNVKENTVEFSEQSFSQPNYVIEESVTAENPAVMINTTYYLFQTEPDSFFYFSFISRNMRDNILEKAIVEAFFKDELAPYISSNPVADEFMFAGRTVKLGNACKWRNPHSVACKGGQISWSEFPSLEEAEMDMDVNILANKKETLPVLTDEFIEIILEGEPTLAYRVAYKSSYSATPLIVYYAAQEIRGHYVSVIMSNRGYNRDDYELSPLLKQFFSIPKIPSWAEKNEFDIPQYEQLTPSESRRLNQPAYSPVYCNFYLGSIVPLGKLSDRFGAAPFFGAGFGYDIKDKSAVEFDFKIGGITNQKEFRYLDYDDAKANLLLNTGLRYYFLKHKINNKFTFMPYFGIGYTGLQTNKVESETDDGTKIYYYVNALDLQGGVKLEYKKFVLLFEYHHTTLSNYRRVDNDFGNTYFSVGLSYKLNMD
jgi:hypothetical protein